MKIRVVNHKNPLGVMFEIVIVIVVAVVVVVLMLVHM